MRPMQRIKCESSLYLFELISAPWHLAHSLEMTFHSIRTNSKLFDLILFWGGDWFIQSELAWKKFSSFFCPPSKRYAAFVPDHQKLRLLCEDALYALSAQVQNRHAGFRRRLLSTQASWLSRRPWVNHSLERRGFVRDLRFVCAWAKTMHELTHESLTSSFQSFSIEKPDIRYFDDFSKRDLSTGRCRKVFLTVFGCCPHQDGVRACNHVDVAGSFCCTGR